MGKTVNHLEYQIRKTAFIFAENRKPNAKRRKTHRPHKTPEPKNRSFEILPAEFFYAMTLTERYIFPLTNICASILKENISAHFSDIKTGGLCELGWVIGK